MSCSFVDFEHQRRGVDYKLTDHNHQRVFFERRHEPHLLLQTGRLKLVALHLNAITKLLNEQIKKSPSAQFDLVIQLLFVLVHLVSHKSCRDVIQPVDSAVG